MRKRERILYAACKHEVAEYGTDHGMNLAKMWAVIHNPADKRSNFWRRECIEDYYIEVLGWTKDEIRQVRGLVDLEVRTLCAGNC